MTRRKRGWYRKEPSRTRMAVALLLSLVVHGLILSLQFGVPGFDFPGLSLPWSARTVVQSELDVHLVLDPNLSSSASASAASAQDQAEAPASLSPPPVPHSEEQAHVPGALVAQVISATDQIPAATTDPSPSPPALRSSPHHARLPHPQNPPRASPAPAGNSEVITTADSDKATFAMPAGDPLSAPSDAQQNPTPLATPSPETLPSLPEETAPAPDEKHEQQMASEKIAEQAAEEALRASQKADADRAQEEAARRGEALAQKAAEAAALLARQEAAVRAAQVQEQARAEAAAAKASELANRLARERAEQERAELAAAKLQQEAQQKQAAADQARQAEAQRAAEAQALAQRQAEAQKAIEAQTVARAQQAEAAKLAEAQRQAQQQAEAERLATQQAEQQAEQRAQAQRLAEQQAANALASQQLQASAAAGSSGLPRSGDRGLAPGSSGTGPGQGKSGAPDRTGPGTGAAASTNLTGRDLAGQVAQAARADSAPARAPLPGADNSRRHTILGRNDRDFRITMYALSWLQKIERNGSLNYPDWTNSRFFVNPIVTVGLRSDGSVEHVTFDRSSNIPEFDAAIRRIVMMQAPYSAFPPGLANEFDVIEIRRMWTFDGTIRILQDMQ